MSKLVPIAFQAPVTARAFITATVAANSFLRSLQASLKRFLSLEPAIQKRP